MADVCKDIYYFLKPKMRLKIFFTTFSFFCGLTIGVTFRVAGFSAVFFWLTPLPLPLLPGRTLRRLALLSRFSALLSAL